MKSIYIKDLQKNQVFKNENFFIISAEEAQDKNGRTYAKIIVGDKTGRMEGKIWSDTYSKLSMGLVKKGCLLTITAKVEDYRGNLQLNVMEINLCDDSNLADYIESSEFDPDEMMGELLSEIENFKDEELKNVVLNILNDKDVAPKFKFWPAGSSIHHGFRSGLLQHILEMISMSKGLKKYYTEVDYDILTVGIILHDIGKMFELDPTGTSADYTPEGSLIGHIVLGAMLFDKFAKGNMDDKKRIHIIHLILSHHGSLEFGSPVLPSTVEAFALTYLDNLSSKSRAAYATLNSIPEGEVFSKFNNWIGGVRIWNGKFKALNKNALFIENMDSEISEKELKQAKKELEESKGEDIRSSSNYDGALQDLTEEPDDLDQLTF